MEANLFKITGILGLMGIIFGTLMFSQKEKIKRRYIYFFLLFGGIFLIIYSIHIKDTIFIVLQLVYTLVVIYNIVKLSKHKIKLKHIAKILAIIYILGMSLFAFDEPLASLNFLIHLLPSITFLISLIIAFFKPKIGAILFVLAGIGTIILFDTQRELGVFLIVSIVPIIIGELFWFSKK